MEKDQIYQMLKDALIELFEVPEGDITPEATLDEDLDLDSIDVIDLVEKLQDVTGRKIEPEEFRSIRTVQDVADRVHDLLEKGKI